MNKEQLAQLKYPTVDVLPKETGYHENDVAEKQQEAFIAGYESNEAESNLFIEALKNIESLCDNQNPTHENIWHIAYEALSTLPSLPKQ